MRVTEQQLRTVVLAQAIEHVDTERTLIGQAEIDDATRSAIAAARERGVQRVDVGDIVLDRTAAIVARASGRDAAIAALERPSVRLQWLARALPLAALLLGLAIDRIANAHRVDLLSAPLLLVLAWNLALYCLLAYRAARPPTGGERVMRAMPALCHWVCAPSARAGRRSLTARIAAQFHQRWFAHTAGLFAQRTSGVLHLCAAAWAAGIASSLLLRGLVVRYQFGWESTFLDAGHVHAIVTVLFWPLTALVGLAPFSLQDIAATQDFAGEGVAGSRWVWMYVGLLALVVVLPRLALVAWARWQQARLTRSLRIDPQDSAFDTVRQGMPSDILVGLQSSDAAQATALHGIVAWHAQQGWCTVRRVIAFASLTPPEPPTASRSMRYWPGAACRVAHLFPLPGRQRPCWNCAGRSSPRAGCWSRRCSTAWAPCCPGTSRRWGGCARPGWRAMKSALKHRCRPWRSTCALLPASARVGARMTMPRAMRSRCRRLMPCCGRSMGMVPCHKGRRLLAPMGCQRARRMERRWSLAHPPAPPQALRRVPRLER